MEVNIEEIAETIAFELMYEYNYITKETEKAEDVFFDTIDKDCYEAIADIKGELVDKVIEIIEKKDINIIY